MKRLALVLATSLFVGCTGVLPSSQTRGASIVLSPRIQDGRYHAQATVSVYTSSSIHHLVVKLFQGSTELASKTLYQANLNQPITFSNLRVNTSYRIKSYAYLANETLISLDTSYLDIATETDDRPSIGSLPVYLTDIDFNAIGSSSIQVTGGGYSLDGPEKMAVVMQGIVSTLAGVKGTSGSLDGPATAALFDVPVGLALDGANLYIADHDKHTIRKIVLTTGTVSTLAGSPGATGSVDDVGTNARFNVPCGLTLDGQGNLFVADESNHTIRKIVLATGAVSTFAGTTGTFGTADGIGTSAQIYAPYGIAVAGNSLYVGDKGTNCTIRKIDLATRAVSTFAGSVGIAGTADGVGTSAQFVKPRALTTDGVNLYVADDTSNTIRKIVLATKEVSTLAGTPGTAGSLDGIGTNAQFNKPYAITTDGTYLYVADRSNNVIRKIDLSSRSVTTLAGVKGSSGSEDGTGAGARFYAPLGILTDGNTVYVSDTSNRIIRMIR